MNTPTPPYHIPDPRHRRRTAHGCALPLGALALFTLIIWWGAAQAWRAAALRSVRATPAMSAPEITRK